MTRRPFARTSAAFAGLLMALGACGQTPKPTSPSGAGASTTETAPAPTLAALKYAPKIPGTAALLERKESGPGELAGVVVSGKTVVSVRHDFKAKSSELAGYAPGEAKASWKKTADGWVDCVGDSPTVCLTSNYEDGEWYLSETFDAAIGQGFNLVTPLQAAMVVGEIAANGKRYQPHLVQRIVDVNGNTVRDFQPVLLSELEVSQNVIQSVQEGLHDVTKIGTAAGVFAGFPIDIAGKTGTAENSQGRDHGWFVAYGPYANPNIVVAVIVEQGGFGSMSAVPIGRKIMEAAFRLDRAPQNAGKK